MCGRYSVWYSSSSYARYVVIVLLNRAVRHACVQFLEQRADEFAPFVGIPFDAYCHQMRQKQAWGGELELQALSRAMHVNWTVWQPRGQPTLVPPCPAANIVRQIDNGF